MAGAPLNPSIVADVLIDWRLGQLSQRDIAKKRGISLGATNKITKGVERDLSGIVSGIVNGIVNAEVQLQQAKQGKTFDNVQHELIVNATTEAVTEQANDLARMAMMAANLQSVGVAGTRTAKRLAEVAARRVDAADDDDLMCEVELKTQMQVAQVVAATSKPGFDLLTLATKPRPPDPPTDVLPLRDRLRAYIDGARSATEG